MKKPPVGSSKQQQQQPGRGVIPSSSKSSTLFDHDFRTSKKDKRTIKHSSFVSKIEKDSQKTPKRRRASKKLAANLDSLADALPDAQVQSSEQHHHPNNLHGQVNVIKQKTLKQKPGALKRRQNLEKVERDRFARNMAQMSAMDTTTTPAPHAEGNNHQNHNTSTEDSNGTSNRWAALRSFISQTMEQQPVFKANQ